jgi:hypothetical protein
MFFKDKKTNKSNVEKNINSEVNAKRNEIKDGNNLKKSKNINMVSNNINLQNKCYNLIAPKNVTI